MKTTVAQDNGIEESHGTTMEDILLTKEMLLLKALRHVRAKLLLRMVQWAMELSMRMEHRRVGLKR